MSKRYSRRLLLALVTVSLTACGGGGGGGGSGLVSTPPPPAPPPPPPPPPPAPPPPQILAGATTSQEFASKGATYLVSLSDIALGQAVPNPLTGNADQLKVRYDAPTNLYEIQLPNEQAWLALAPVTGGSNQWVTSGANPVTISAGSGGYSAFLSWNGSDSMGVTAIGIPTPQSSIPTIGGASFWGALRGLSSETTFSAVDGHAPGTIGGRIIMTFNFGSGTLSGFIEPSLTLGQAYALGRLDFQQTIYSVGGTNFSGSFATTIPGLNSFSGLFVGPDAGGVIGGFAFPYLSPVDSRAQQAAGAFVAADRRVEP